MTRPGHTTPLMRWNDQRKKPTKYATGFRASDSWSHRNIWWWQLEAASKLFLLIVTASSIATLVRVGRYFRFILIRGWLRGISFLFPRCPRPRPPHRPFDLPRIKEEGAGEHYCKLIHCRLRCWISRSRFMGSTLSIFFSPRSPLWFENENDSRGGEGGWGLEEMGGASLTS